MFAPTNPEHAEIIKTLQTKLAAVPMGAVLSYSALSKVAGRDVRARYRYLLTAAIEATEKELGCVFSSVRGEGIKRLLSSSAPDVGLAALRRCRSAAKRGKRRLDRINSNSLSEPERRRTIGYSAMLGAVHMLADGRKAAAISVVAEPGKAIPPENILEMFREKV